MKCKDCFNWENPDDPHEACKNNFGADPNDEGCEVWCEIELRSKAREIIYECYIYTSDRSDKWHDNEIERLVDLILALIVAELKKRNRADIK